MFEQQGYGWEKYYVSAGFNTISYEGCRVGKYFFGQYKFIKKNECGIYKFLRETR